MIRRNTRIAQNAKNLYPDPKISNLKTDLPATKVKAIQEMLPWMPKQDQEYYKHVIPNLINEKKSKNLRKK